MATIDPKKPPEKRGPKPETLKLEGKWEEAVGKAVRKPAPVVKRKP